MKTEIRSRKEYYKYSLNMVQDYPVKKIIKRFKCSSRLQIFTFPFFDFFRQKKNCYLFPLKVSPENMKRYIWKVEFSSREKFGEAIDNNLDRGSIESMRVGNH